MTTNLAEQGLEPSIPRASADEMRNVCDCHVHVFDDVQRFPFKVASAYEPPYSPASTLMKVSRAAGIGRVVLVQPTPYGDDIALLTESLSAFGGRARGVGVAAGSITADALQRMKDGGIVALRFVGTKLADGSPIPGSTPMDVLYDRLAPVLSQLGMHAELWAPLPEVLLRWNRLEKTGIPLVLDHMGGFDPALGCSNPHFQRLLALLREGAVWVKLAICRRVSGLQYEPLRPFHDAMIEANSNHLLWGSDFPFVRYPGQKPTTENLLAQFHSWVPDERLAHRILVQNPALLYQFNAGSMAPGAE